MYLFSIAYSYFFYILHILKFFSIFAAYCTYGILALCCMFSNAHQKKNKMKAETLDGERENEDYWLCGKPIFW